MYSLFENAALRPDLGRAFRSSVAFVVPLLLGHLLKHPSDAVFISITAQSITLADLRGAYAMRFVILAAMTVIVACSACLGVLAGGHVLSATLAMGGLALLGGGWRHLSADYGPSLSVTSALLFLLGLAQPGTLSDGWHLAGSIVLGGLGAMLLQMAFWPFRPQHPLRYAVAETWVAASDLVATMRPIPSTAPESRSAPATNPESELRAALDRTFVILGAAKNRQTAAFLAHLEELRREVVHFAMYLTAFHGALEALLPRPDFARHLPAIDSVLKASSDLARSVAITLITHRAENFGATQIRLRRCQDLIRVLDERLAADAAADVNITQASATLDRVTQMLPRLRAALAETVDHATGRAAPPTGLPELTARPMRALAAWINPAPRLDPVLIRYALRMAVLTMVAVAAYKGFAIPRGYWIAFTIVVVLQPDYGATRQRAAERMGGTLAGSLLASALLLLRMPAFLLGSCATLMAFCFAYFVKRRYGLAVFFVTLMLVLVTQTMAPVHLDFTITRLLCNLAGGTLALISAVVFWPIWEGEKFTSLLAAAIRTNRAYLESIVAFLDRTNPGLDLLVPKRRAENANRYALASLQRMLAEPRSRTENAGRAAALATYNQRITRAFTAIVAGLSGPSAAGEAVPTAEAREINDALEMLARVVEEDGRDTIAAELRDRLAALESLLSRATAPPPPAGGTLPAAQLIQTHLAKVVVEIRAMTLALDSPSDTSLAAEAT